MKDVGHHWPTSFSYPENKTFLKKKIADRYLKNHVYMNINKSLPFLTSIWNSSSVGGDDGLQRTDMLKEVTDGSYRLNANRRFPALGSRSV